MGSVKPRSTGIVRSYAAMPRQPSVGSVSWLACRPSQYHMPAIREARAPGGWAHAVYSWMSVIESPS